MATTTLTSNPLMELQAQGQSVWYDNLRRGRIMSVALQDIAQAADMLRPIYGRTDGLDGYVSIEVSPTLAHDLPATLNEARHLWSALNRPNIMVKVPATPEGIPAIQTL